jgi:hypothetical protein
MPRRSWLDATPCNIRQPLLRPTKPGVPCSTPGARAAEPDTVTTAPGAGAYWRAFEPRPTDDGPGLDHGPRRRGEAGPDPRPAGSVRRDHGSDQDPCQELRTCLGGSVQGAYRATKTKEVQVNPKWPTKTTPRRSVDFPKRRSASLGGRHRRLGVGTEAGAGRVSVGPRTGTAVRIRYAAQDDPLALRKVIDLLARLLDRR